MFLFFNILLFTISATVCSLLCHASYMLFILRMCNVSYHLCTLYHAHTQSKIGAKIRSIQPYSEWKQQQNKQIKRIKRRKKCKRKRWNVHFCHENKISRFIKHKAYSCICEIPLYSLNIWVCVCFVCVCVCFEKAARTTVGRRLKFTVGCCCCCFSLAYRKKIEAAENLIFKIQAKNGGKMESSL